MGQIHLGHVFHLAGSPLITEAAAALVSISDGALVFDDGGHITFCGDRTEIPPEHGSATVFDHRPGFLLPGFVDTHVHFPQTYAGDVDTALLHVAIVPRFALSVTRETLKSLGELYESVRDRGVYFHTHLNENNRPGTGEVDSTKETFEINSYLDAYDGKFLPGSAVGGQSLLGRRSIG